MTRYFDRDGSSMTLVEWAKALEDDTKRRVTEDWVGEAHISTVWLGLDHSFTRGPKPIIFETMVFGGVNDEWQYRYSTEAEALAGHARVVAAIQNDENLEGLDLR